MTRKLQLLLLLSLGSFCKVFGAKKDKHPKLTQAIKYYVELDTMRKSNNGARGSLRIEEEDSYSEISDVLADLNTMRKLVNAVSEENNDDIEIELTKCIQGLDGTYTKEITIKVAPDEENKGGSSSTLSLKLNRDVDLGRQGDAINLDDLRSIVEACAESYSDLSDLQNTYSDLKKEKKDLASQAKHRSEAESDHLGKPGSLLRSWNDNKWHCKGVALFSGLSLATYSFMSNPEQEVVKVNSDGSTIVTKKMSPRQRYLAAVGSVVSVTAIMSSALGSKFFSGSLDCINQTKEAFSPSLNLSVKPVIDGCLYHLLKEKKVV